MLETTNQLVNVLPDLLGVIGVSCVLWYYFLLQIGKCSAKDLNFSVANFIGSLLLLISLWFNWNLPAVIIEISWVFISLYGIVNYFRPSISAPEKQF